MWKPCETCPSRTAEIMQSEREVYLFQQKEFPSNAWSTYS